MYRPTYCAVYFSGKLSGSRRDPLAPERMAGLFDCGYEHRRGSVDRENDSLKLKLSGGGLEGDDFNHKCYVQEQSIYRYQYV